MAFIVMLNSDTERNMSVTQTETTFAGLPGCNDIHERRPGAAIIGIPHGTPYELGEASHSAGAPAAIRAASARFAGMIEHYDFDLGGTLLGDSGFTAVDCGDVPGDPSDPEGNRKQIEKAIRTILAAGSVPVVIGGDDSIPIPFFKAFVNRGPITLVQIDAHIDWRQEINGVSLGLSSTMRRASEMPWISSIIQVGARGVGSARPRDLQDALASGVTFVTAEQVAENGIGAVLDLVPEGGNCLITLDVDGLDPVEMPAVLYPVPGGLSFRQVTGLVHGLAGKSSLIGFDLVEFVSSLDSSGLAAVTAARIVWNVIGTLARQADA